jgi:hypothetical protein
MATASRCALETVRAKIIPVLAVAAAMAVAGWTSTARAEFDDGAGACSSDWGNSDSSGTPSTGTVTFSVDAATDDSPCDEPISLTGDAAPDACDGVLLFAVNGEGCGGSDGGFDWGDHGFHGPTIYGGGGHVITDSVKLPEPGSLGLLGLAAFGVMTRRTFRV